MVSSDSNLRARIMTARGMPSPDSCLEGPGQADTEVDPVTPKQVLRHPAEEDDVISDYETGETGLLPFLEMALPEGIATVSCHGYAVICSLAGRQGDWLSNSASTRQ